MADDTKQLIASRYRLLRRIGAGGMGEVWEAEDAVRGVASAPMFKGIPADAFDFFDELAEHNTKAWWTENKDRYQRSVRGPVEELLTAIADEFGPDAKIFRPYRDARFSKDKTPYKTNLGATSTSKKGSVYYFALMPDGMFLGTGYYQMAKDQIDAYRAAVGDEKKGPALAALAAAIEKKGYELGGQQLKRVPKPYEQDHPRSRLLKHKGLYAGKQLEPAAWMGTKKALDRITAAWRELDPLNEWLHAHVGPSTMPSGW